MPVKKELSDLRWQVDSQDSSERWRGVVIVRHGGVEAVVVCLFHSCCNGHYNRTPDLGRCVIRWDVWDLARHSILDAKVLDHNITWLTKHKDTS